MSYVKKQRSGPEIGVGGFSTTESLYAAGSKRRKATKRKTRSRKGGKSGAPAWDLSPRRF